MLKEKLLEIKENMETSEFCKWVIDDILEYGGSDEDISDYMKQVYEYGCINGTVSSLIYYSDIRPVFEKYYDDILEIFNHNLCEFGQPPCGEVNFNNLTWLAYEETIRDLGLDLGMEF